MCIRDSLVAELPRICIAKKMPACDQHVGGYHELVAAFNSDQRRVVADAEDRMARAMGEIARDQIEFRRGHAEIPGGAGARTVARGRCLGPACPDCSRATAASANTAGRNRPPRTRKI